MSEQAQAIKSFNKKLSMKKIEAHGKSAINYDKTESPQNKTK
jgi:hypothetical protein